jgi:UDP-N-acetylglucosamine:LPS N-acetylglucosamine transferase
MAQIPGGAQSVLFVCSSGGHLAQLLALRPWWSGRRTRWVTFDTADAVSLLDGQDTTWAYYPTTRHIPNLLRNSALAWRVLREERPDVIVSTGAAVAYPFFVLAKLLRIPTVYIEVFDRIDSTTLTGRLCRPFTDRMLVQWEAQAELYRDAVVVGTLL